MQVRDGTELLSVVFQLIIRRVAFLFHPLVPLATAERNFVQNTVLRMLFVASTLRIQGTAVAFSVFFPPPVLFSAVIH